MSVILKTSAMLSVASAHILWLFVALGNCGWVASVIALPDQKTLFDSFNATWSLTWPGIKITLVDAVAESTGGLGICKSIVKTLTADQQIRPNEPSLVFEPDALPFPDVNYPPFNPVHLNSSIAIYFMGGHHIISRNGTDEPPDAFEWRSIIHLYGCYGMVFPAASRPMVIDGLTRYCGAQHPHYHTDVFLSQCFAAAVATPLLVDHPRKSFSHTWHRHRDDKWAGRRDWWNLDKVVDPRFACKQYVDAGSHR